jgi:hypothetical protein
MVFATVTMAFSEFALVAHEVGDSRSRFILQGKLFYASESLVATAGYPPDWNAGNVERLGLARVAENTVKHHELDAGKMGMMKEMNASSIKSHLNLEGYDIGIRLTETGSRRVILENGNASGTTVRRFALCPQPCMLEISGVLPRD